MSQADVHHGGGAVAVLLLWLLKRLVSQDLAMYGKETTKGTVLEYCYKRDLSLDAVSVVRIVLAAKQPLYFQG